MYAASCCVVGVSESPTSTRVSFQSYTIEELTAVVVEGNLSTKFREKLRQICFAATATFAVSLCRLLSNLFDILLISRKVSQNHG